MKKQLNVPKGNDVVGLNVTGHTYVRLVNSRGEETFRFDSPGEHVRSNSPRSNPGCEAGEGPTR